MVDATHISFRADDRSYYSLLKKDIHQRAVDAGFSKKQVAELDIIVSEMTSNLAKHALGGEILLGTVASDGNEYIEVISIDNGPGMQDPQKMIADGMSTTNTLGHGLGSIKRLSDRFEIFSQKGWGTIVLSRLSKKENPKKKHGVEIVPFVVAKPGETTSGDGCYYKLTDEYFKLLVADGLGHGADANKAVNEAVNAFKICPFDNPVEILQFIHTSIRKTRGIVGTVVLFNLKTKTWRIAGIGNISTKMANAFSSRNYLAYNGIIGHNIPNSMKVQEFSINDFQQVILCSDGIKSRWDLARYPGIGKYDPTIQASALYKDFGRRTDDMSIVIGKVKI